MSVELQYQIRQNSEKLMEYLKDLGSWEEEIKKKDRALKKAGATRDYSKFKGVGAKIEFEFFFCFASFRFVSILWDGLSQSKIKIKRNKFRFAETAAAEARILPRFSNPKPTQYNFQQPMTTTAKTTNQTLLLRRTLLLHPWKRKNRKLTKTTTNGINSTRFASCFFFFYKKSKKKIIKL